jgi:hypothetical protein
MGLWCFCLVLSGFVWFCLVLSGFVWFCLVLSGFVLLMVCLLQAMIGHCFHDPIGEAHLTARGHHNPHFLSVFISILTDNVVETSEPSDKLSSIGMRYDNAINVASFVRLFFEEAFHGGPMMRSSCVPGLALAADIASIVIIQVHCAHVQWGGYRAEPRRFYQFLSMPLGMFRLLMR